VLDAIYTHSDAVVGQITLQSLRTTGFAGTLVRRSNLDFQAGILFCPSGQGAIPSSVVATFGYIKNSTHHRYRVLLSPFFHAAVPHRNSLAK
jgi:hypothetical protein